MEYSILFRDDVLPKLFELRVINETFSYYEAVEKTCDFICKQLRRLTVGIELIKMRDLGSFSEGFKTCVSEIVECHSAPLAVAYSCGPLACVGGPDMEAACLKLCNVVDDWVDQREDLALRDKSREECLRAYEVVRKKFQILLDTLRKMASEAAPRTGKGGLGDKLNYELKPTK